MIGSCPNLRITTSHGGVETLSGNFIGIDPKCSVSRVRRSVTSVRRRSFCNTLVQSS